MSISKYQVDLTGDEPAIKAPKDEEQHGRAIAGCVTLYLTVVVFCAHMAGCAVV
jgi:hypothetical protein